CLDSWSRLNKENILSYEDVANQVIWNNKHIIIKKHSVFEKHLLEENILTVADLFFRRVNRDLSPTDRFKLMGLRPGFRINLLMFILYYFIIYSLSFKVPLETKISEFQYKVLNNIVFTNEKLFKIEMIDSPQCTFCKNEI
ncbi:unnamed protein product, partial [Porites evermanni]